MERTLTIDGRPVVFRATAAVPRLYRMEYGRDIMQDMLELQTAIDAAQGGRGPIPPRLLSIFEDMSYLMAKHARPDEVTATSSEEWLDGFDTFSVYQVFPAIAQLWQANLKTTSTPKKTRPTERTLTTGLFYLRALQLGLTNADLERMTVGMVTDLIIEAGNDKEPYCELATQEDFDRF